MTDEQIVSLWKEIVKDLGLARERISLYPELHPAAIKAIKRLNENFNELLSLKLEVSLGIFQDKLAVDGKPLELAKREEKFQREFALCLHRRGIANLIFSLGLEAQEIHKFLKIITIDPKTIIKQGGIAQVFLENGLVHIRVNEADYRHIFCGKDKLSAKEVIERSLFPEKEARYIPEYKERLSALGKTKEEYSEEEREKIGILFEHIDEEGIARGKILTIAEMLILEKEKEECLQMIDEAVKKAKRLIMFGRYKTLCSIFKALRMMASYELIDRMSHEIIDDLISALYTLETKIQREEVSTLLSHLSRKVVPSLMDRLSQEENKDNRFILISAITSLEKDSAKDVISGLDDSRWYVVRNTVHILRQVKDKSQINALLKPLRHKEMRVRLEAIEALGELRDQEVLHLLILGLKDENRHIRELSLRYLVAIGGERSIATLLRILEGGDYYLKMEAIRSLGEIGSPKAVKGLAIILKGFSLWNIRKNNRLRASAARALGKIGTEEAREILEEGARHFLFPSLRKACQEALDNLSINKAEN